jgi:hypothetical protein
LVTQAYAACRRRLVQEQELPKQDLIKRWGRAFLVWFCIGACPAGVRAQDARVTATVSTDTVGIQDQFQLTVTVTGNDAGQALTPRLPRLQGFKVVAGPSLSTQFQWINGKSSSSRSFIYILLPEKEGQFTIDAIEVKVGNRTYQTRPIPMRVTSAARAPAPARQAPSDPFSMETPAPRPKTAGEEVFVAAELDRTSVFVGQQVTLAYHLYTQVGVSGLQLQENPPLNGFWVENIETNAKPAPERKVINGKEYLDYVVKKQALFPNAAGKLKIPSSTFAVSVKSTGDLFGFFAQADTIYRRTNEVILEVKPLPAEGRPAGFNNAVGTYALAGELNKPASAAGDAVSFTLKLTGKGNLKAIPDIPLPAMPDLIVYSSKREDKVQPEGDLIGGEKVWEYVMVPKMPGDHQIPPISFSFFDPERQRYETVSTQPAALKVTPGSESTGSFTSLSGVQKQQLTRQGSDINFIKLAGELERPAPPIYRSPWFHVAWLLPLAFHLGAFLAHRERSRRSADLVLAQSRKARRLAISRLRKAWKSGRSDPRRFYDEAGTALARYLADKFNLPEIAVNADSLASVMAGREIPEEIVQETMSALQECDFGRFVSASSSPEQQKGLADRIRRVIDRLERAGK